MSSTQSFCDPVRERNLEAALEAVIECFDTGSVPFTLETKTGIEECPDDLSIALERAMSVLYEEATYEEGDT